jgi:hypothetical protein
MSLAGLALCFGNGIGVGKSGSGRGAEMVLMKELTTSLLPS